MQTYRAWLPGSIQQRPAFVKVRADHSDHEQIVRAARLPAIDADIQRRAAEHLVELREYRQRIERLMRRAKRGSHRRQVLASAAAATRHEIDGLETMVGAPMPTKRELPRYIENHGPGYRVKMSRLVNGEVVTVRSETHATIRAAVAAIGQVRLRLENLIAEARESA